MIGVDVGGTKILAGVVGRDLRVHARAQRPVPNDDQDRIIAALVDAVDEVRSSAAPETFAVGVGVPCLFDEQRGTAVMAVNLRWAEIDLHAVLSERLGVPVFLDNDANLAMLAELRAGAARGARHAAMLTVGTGIGGAVVFGGELYRGASGAAGELGHMVVDEDGPPCQGNCPNYGCLEAVASGTALAREAARVARSTPDCGLGRAFAAGREMTGALVTELAHDGDAAARDVVALVGTRLGIGIGNIVNMLNPEVIVIGGGVIAAGELLLAPAREVVRTRTLPPPREHARIERTHFGVESGMIGAAILAFDGVDGRAQWPQR